MLCGNCGIENEENATVCTNCGYDLTQEQAAPKHRNKRSLILSLTAVALTVAAILSILALVFVIRTPRSAVNSFFTAYVKCDAKTIMNLVPDSVRESLEAKSVTVDVLNQRLVDSVNALGASGAVYSFKATNVKDVEDADLEALQQYYADTYGRVVSAAKSVEVRVSATTNGETTESTVSVRVIRIGMRWYLDIFTFGNWLWL